MNNKFLTGLFAALITLAIPLRSFAQSKEVGTRKHLIFHDIRVDASGNLLPWYADDPATAYDHILGLLWKYLKNIPGDWARDEVRNEHYPDWRKQLPFPPKYMIYRTFEDQGIAGDQYAMMLSSLGMYYDYTGDPDVLANMIFQADWYLSHSLSNSADGWPDIPYPCNTTHAPIYDGDLLLGKSVTQPDKAGDFGAELVTLYKRTTNQKYLDAAIKIANTLSKHTKSGDYNNSPIPFKVNAVTGELKSAYTTNWVGTLRLFKALTSLAKGDTPSYAAAYKKIIDWLEQYPMKNNRWGPFFEDISAWSDTEINEGTLAWYILNNRDQFTDWKTQVRAMQDWAIAVLGIDHWKQFGCTVMGEQSIYKMQGQSHTSRHASVELLYAALTRDSSRVAEAIHQLNFATYAVDDDGKCRWMNFDTYEIWWTDGYADFIRHYLRSMASMPQLAPATDHILSSSSVIERVSYAVMVLSYTTFDNTGEEKIRLVKKPTRISLNEKPLTPLNIVSGQGFTWTPMTKGGLLTIYRQTGNRVLIK